MIHVLAIVTKMNRGGIESRLLEILRYLDTTRIRLDIFTHELDAGELDAEVLGLGAKIYYNPHLGPENMLWYPGYFASFLQKHPEYQIVHAHQDAWCSVFCEGARRAGIPVNIAHSHTALQGNDPATLVKNIIKLPARTSATHLMAVSRKAGEWLFGTHLVADEKVAIWPNAIDYQLYQYNAIQRQELRRLYKLEDKQVFIHVGNFVAAKNHNFLIEVMAQIKQLNKQAVLLLVGGGDNTACQEQVQALGLEDCVHFLGKRDDVPALLQMADIFLFPSIFEGLPGVVFEAQAAGLPCLISAEIACEVSITNLVKFLPLSKGADHWAQVAQAMPRAQRPNNQGAFVKAGLDIRDYVARLMVFYEESLRQAKDHD